MHRLTVALLAAVDAVVAAAVGLAATLTPLTALWVFGFGASADWSGLWPAAGTVWQFGHLVPLEITLPGDYLAVAGIDPSAASFALSLSPLALVAFTAIFAARSGIRASRSDAWITGVVSGAVVFGGIAALVALTSRTEPVVVDIAQAVLLPLVVFVVPLAAGAVTSEWREAPEGSIARLRDRVDALAGGWGRVVDLSLRGAVVVAVGMLGLGAVAFAVTLIVHGGGVIALYEAGHVDVLGATIVTLGQFAYLPTFIVWALSFVAGPGFALGAGTAVSPAGTSLGVLPGIPVLAAVPETTSAWLLLLALLPVALGAFAGWIARSQLVGDRDGSGAGRYGPRAAIAGLIAALAAGAAALLAVLASGAFGPGRLVEMGPHPGMLALAVGVETLVGAAILLLSPWRPRSRGGDGDMTTGDGEPLDDAIGQTRAPHDQAVSGEARTADDTPTLDLGRPEDLQMRSVDD